MTLVEARTPKVPNILYHGTNLIAACLIVKDGEIRADYPVDDADLGKSVSTTKSPRIAKMFANEFAREASRLDIGAVFQIDGVSVRNNTEIVHHEAETASENEFEFRVLGNIPLTRVKAVKIIGKKRFLNDDDFLMSLYEDEASRYFSSYTIFYKALTALMKMTGDW
jgi:hypothetical protein